MQKSAMVARQECAVLSGRFGATSRSVHGMTARSNMWRHNTVRECRPKRPRPAATTGTTSTSREAQSTRIVPATPRHVDGNALEVVFARGRTGRGQWHTRWPTRRRLPPILSPCTRARCPMCTKRSAHLPTCTKRGCHHFLVKRPTANSARTARLVQRWPAMWSYRTKAQIIASRNQMAPNIFMPRMGLARVPLPYSARTRLSFTTPSLPRCPAGHTEPPSPKSTRRRKARRAREGARPSSPCPHRPEPP